MLSHRGARFEAPENTLTGFAYALRLGVTALEFDVRLTKDDEVVVIHDATVDRTTNGHGAVADLTLAELQTLDARSIHTDWPEPAVIPRLADVLHLVAPVATMEIEIKPDSPARYARLLPRVLAVMDAVGRHEGVVLTSFDAVALEAVHALRPEQAVGYVGDWDDPAMAETAQRVGAVKAGVHLSTATPEIVAKLRSLGLVTVGWPVNDEAAVDHALACGVDQICTDAPSVIGPMVAAKLAGR